MFSVSKAMSILCFSVALFAIAAKAQGITSSKKQNAHIGEQIFIQKCFACHSVIQDQVRFGPSLYNELTKAPHKKTATQVRTILIYGKGKMPSFKDVLTKEDFDNLIAYIRTL